MLEQQGLHERQRRVFISHRRSVALEMAEQIHDHLVTPRFEPFIDRFDIAPGEDVQRRIEEALSDTAFVLFINSPDAHTSPWVIHEVHYALLHSLGVFILGFPCVPAVAGTDDLPSIALADVPATGQARILSGDEHDGLAERVERIHAESLVRQCLRLVTHTTEVASRAGFDVRGQPDRFLLLYDSGAAGRAGSSGSCSPTPRRTTGPSTARTRRA